MITHIGTVRDYLSTIYLKILNENKIGKWGQVHIKFLAKLLPQFLELFYFKEITFCQSVA